MIGCAITQAAPIVCRGPSKGKAPKRENSLIPHTGVWDCLRTAYKRRPLEPLLRIPPTEVGGLFKYSLQTTAARTASSNTTHGSGWIVQVQPTREPTGPFYFCFSTLALRDERRKGKTGNPCAPPV